MEVASWQPTFLVLSSVSNQWPSGCNVNNFDEMGRPGRWFCRREQLLTQDACSLNGALAKVVSGRLDIFGYGRF